jgi:hypothetical protein
MIQCLDSEGNNRVFLSDQQSFIGSISCVDSGMVEISEGIVKETVPIPTINVISINPPLPAPEFTYRAILNAGGAEETGNTDSIEGHFSTLFVVKLKRQKSQVYA